MKVSPADTAWISFASLFRSSVCAIVRDKG
jgi:hypothetical protein